MASTQFDRDGNGNDQLAYSEQVNHTDGIGKTVTTKNWYDGAGRVVRSGVGAGLSPGGFDMIGIVYDSLGRESKRSNPYSGDSSGNGTPQYWTTSQYDVLSRVKLVTFPDGQTAETTHAGGSPGVGATVTVKDQAGRERKSEVDGLGRVVKVTEENPDSGQMDSAYVTTYTYDALDNLKQVSQGTQSRNFNYDALSRLISQTTPEAGTVTFTYTTFDAVATRTDARGVVTTYGYDSLNRLQTISYNTSGAPGVAATPGVTISYKATSPGYGQISSVTDATGGESFAYDSLGRVSSKTRTIDSRSYQTQYLYNNASQITTLIYPSGKRVRVNRDSQGRMSGIDKVDSSGNVLASYMSGVAYNSAGVVSGFSLGNGVTEGFTYNNRLQMETQKVTKAGGPQGGLMSLTYGYESATGQMGMSTSAGNTGQLVSITGTVNGANRDQAFTYDNVGRLKTATGWGTWQRRYAYDRFGNRTGMWNATSGGTQLQSITIASVNSVVNNRIANVNGVSYTYDASGNVTWDGGYNFAYDGESRQVSVNSGGTASYGYDNSGRRVKKVAGGVTTHYVWEGSQVIAEYNGSTGALISENIYAGTKMVAREQAGVTRYFHQDRLSTRLITDGTGNAVGTEDYLPFGEEAGVVGESEKHRFTNYERDGETGTDYAVNQQYQMSAGRYMQVDPISGEIDDPQSFNRYSYVGNDPINFADPSGLKSWCFGNHVWLIDISRATGEVVGVRYGGFIADFCVDVPESDPCFNKLEKAFGGNAVGSDHHSFPGQKHPDPYYGTKAHINAGADGKGQTNIYVPAGFAYGVWLDDKLNSTAYFYYGNKGPGIFGLKNVTLLIQHLANPNREGRSNRFKTGPVENGRVYIGTTGGFDGGGIQRSTVHVHIELFRGEGLPPLRKDVTDEKQQTYRNARRIPWREAFCK